jgi:hypothetical protein
MRLTLSERSRRYRDHRALCHMKQVQLRHFQIDLVADSVDLLQELEVRFQEDEVTARRRVLAGLDDSVCSLLIVVDKEHCEIRSLSSERLQCRLTK